LTVLYLDVLSVAAVVARHVPPSVSARHHIGVLIPAHNEERLLPRLLKSISDQDYPRALYDVHIVADNCTDSTADIGRSAGAFVHERTDESARGKGYALQWLINRLSEPPGRYDAYLIVDADSTLSANFLTVLNNHLARGDEVVQSYDGVLNEGDSWVSALSFIALALFNNLRPLGRDALGLSVGLHGNGMCFSSAIINNFGWDSFGLAEDHAFHIRLVRAGVTVRYASRASVLAEQPTSLRQAYTQGVRWERGRFQLFSPRLLFEGIRHRNMALVDVFAEQAIPPFSLLTGLVVAAVSLTAALHLEALLILAITLVLGETFYVLVGLRLVRAKLSMYLGLLTAPVYVVWKIWVILAAAVPTGGTLWVRTSRPNEEG
jgi:cellulose synthase/poly-beta-1,6-N-acetylglucosamine synthase-like glycosyltransferase